MVGLVIVSHSKKIAEGVVDLAWEMAGPDLALIAAGGLDDGGIGTDAFRIKAAIEEADRGSGVLILADLGSALMSAETAIEFLREEDNMVNVRIADAPLVEGAISAAVTASTNSTLEEALTAAIEAKLASKL
jgi:dihydroxyacetone kinase phosphotransfer subunit